MLVVGFEPRTFWSPVCRAIQSATVPALAMEGALTLMSVFVRMAKCLMGGLLAAITRFLVALVGHHGYA